MKMITHQIYLKPWGTSIIAGQGDVDLTSSLKENFGTRSSKVHQIREETWEVLLPQDEKVAKASQFWGHIRNAKCKNWGTCHIHL